MSAESPASPHMPTTTWSLIARLRQGTEREADAALDELCRAYHYPLYCQIRRRGLSHHDAEDALHEFLLKLLRLDTFGIADSEKGRLRTFLLVALQRFLSTWHDRNNRKEAREISSEALASIANAEGRFQIDQAAHQESPDRLYDRQWAQELINQVLRKLRQQYESKGRGPLFDGLRPVLLTGGSLTDECGEHLASGLALRPGAVRTALHRLREDFRETLRREILQTVADNDMAKAEHQVLMAVFREG